LESSLSVAKKVTQINTEQALLFKASSNSALHAKSSRAHSKFLKTKTKVQR